MKIKMIFAGDLVPTCDNILKFVNADLEQLFGEELLNIWLDNDFRSFNLETPLVNNCNPIEKNGASISAKRETINGLVALKPSLVTLANNHIMDYGAKGLNSTLDLLLQYKIAYAGVGENIAAARAPYITEIKGIKIGVYTCVEHEFSEATEYSPGANVYDPLDVFDDIVHLKNKCDIVITLFHGGKEHYRYPTPDLQKICRKFVDKGSNIVICQHSHCIGCEEKYKEGTIIYGQGNFLFDRGDSEFRKTSILVRATVDTENLRIDIDYIPLIKTNQYVRLAKGIDGKQILENFATRSEEIKRVGFVKNNFSEFCDNKYTEYVAALLGRKKALAVLNKISGGRYMNSYYSTSSVLRIYNYIKCEAHREVLLESLRRKIERNG